MSTIPTCPPWCVLEPGHKYESTEDDGTEYRYHALGAKSGATVDVAAREDRTVEGVVTVALSSFGFEWDECTEGDSALARTLAAELLAAADAIDQINGATS